MNELFSKVNKENNLKIQEQFNNWFTGDRGRQVKGISNFLNDTKIQSVHVPPF